MQKFTAAVVQAAPVFMNLEASLTKALGLIDEAARTGARLIAFPETWLPGYPWFIWLDHALGWMQFVPEYHANCLPTDSSLMGRLCAAARANAINVVMGFAERAGRSLYMAQAVISDSGELLYTRRKLKPTHVERTVFGEGDGSDVRLAELAIANVGALNCWEHLQPLLRMSLYALHEEVHVAAWPSLTFARGMAHALGPEMTIAASSFYALEGGCYVLSATAVTGEDVIARLADTPQKLQLLSPLTGKAGGGFSMIYGPDGRALCEYLAEDREGLLYADIEPAMIAIAKSVADPVGHYSRPDIFNLRVNRTRRSLVTMEDAPVVNSALHGGNGAPADDLNIAS